jgi:uncharacterized protein YbaP (TraB family)
MSLLIKKLRWVFGWVAILVWVTPVCAEIQIPYLFAAKRLDKTSFIFGTIHLGVRASELPDFVKEAIESRPFFASEMGVEKGPTRYKTGFNVARNWSRLSKRTKDEILSIEYFNHDWESTILFVNSMPYEALGMAVATLACRSGPELSRGFKLLDHELTDLAVKRGRPISRLDRDELLIAQTQESLPKFDIEEMFSTKTVASIREDFKRVVLEYGTGDLQYAQNDESEVMKKRNESWIPSIESLHEQGGVAVVVGANHLGGKHGILTLLARAGFEIRQITDGSMLEE